MQLKKINIGTVLTIMLIGAFSFNSSYSQKKEKTLQTNDTLETIQYVIHEPIKDLGQYDLNAYRSIKKDEIQFINYFTTNDIINNSLNIYPLVTGNLASRNSFQLFGERNNSYQLNGRTLASGLQDFNAFFISPEAFEKIEIYKGINAVTLANTSSLINFQERIFNTAKPYVRFWIGEGLEDFNGADVVLSQNFAPNWNGTLNFGGTGDPYFYSNSGYEAWKLHSKFRYNFDSTRALSFAFMHDHKIEGMFGGIDPDLSEDQNEIFSTDPVDAVSIFSNMNRREIRNEFNSSYTKLLDSTGHKYSITAYLSNVESRYNRDDIFIRDTLTNNKFLYSSNYAGFNAFLKSNLLGFEYLAGVFTDLSIIGFTPYSDNKNDLNTGAYLKLNKTFTNGFEYGIGIRSGLNNSEFFLNFGGELIKRFNSFNISLDLSRSNQILNNFLVNDHKETHDLIIFGLEDNQKNYGINAYFRSISNDLEFATVQDSISPLYSLDQRIYNSTQRFGLSAFFNKRFETSILLDNDAFYVRLFLNSNFSSFDGDQITDIPLLNGSVDLSYFFNIGRSALKAGTKFTFTTNSSGLGYHPLYDVYYFYESDQEPMLDNLDFYLIFKLGRAHLKFTFTNVLGSQTNFLAWYPILNPNVRLTASWTIID